MALKYVYSEDLYEEYQYVCQESIKKENKSLENYGNVKNKVSLFSLNNYGQIFVYINLTLLISIISSLQVSITNFHINIS